MKRSRGVLLEEPLRVWRHCNYRNYWLVFPRHDQLQRNNDISVLFWPMHSEGNLFWVTGRLQGTTWLMRARDQGEESFQLERCQEEGHYFEHWPLLGCTPKCFSLKIFSVWCSTGFTVKKKRKHLLFLKHFFQLQIFNVSQVYNICSRLLRQTTVLTKYSSVPVGVRITKKVGNHCSTG